MENSPVIKRWIESDIRRDGDVHRDPHPPVSERGRSPAIPELCCTDVLPEAFPYAYGPFMQTNDYANPPESSVTLLPDGVTRFAKGPAEVHQESGGFEEDVMIYYHAALASASAGGSIDEFSIGIDGQEDGTLWP